MSEPVRYDYGTPLCTVQESRKLVVEGCDPETIQEELLAANFVQDESKFVKKRPRLRAQTDGDDEDDALQVLSARFVDDTLYVSPSDVVGIVQLVPGMSVEIEPKIEWDDVLEMLLSVYNIDRSQTPYGVPLEELLSNGVKSVRILAILAINYVHGVRDIHREGFIRDLHIRRRNGFEGLGSIDVGQSIMNQATGNPAPTWVETNVEYSNAINGAIHMAGKLLLRLLQQDQNGQHHPRQDVLVSMVHQEVKRMERLGIQSSQKHIGEYRRLSLHDLPRQRSYYRRAFHTTQSILASTLLGQTGGGPEELLVDYALSMNKLFEDYSHTLLTRILDSLDTLDHLDQLATVECKHEPPLHPFDDDGAGHHKPDHLLCDDGEAVAVMDSKYYREGKNPAVESGNRSQLFAYAYLTDTDNMAILCPHYRPVRIPVEQTGGEIQILSPEGEFTCDSYEEQLREYVLKVLSLRHPELHVFAAAADGQLCLDVSQEELSAVHDTNGPFSISNPTTFASRIISTITFSSSGPNITELDDQGRWTKSRIKDACNRSDADDRPKYPQHETTCVPVYDHDGNSGYGTITLYFLTVRDEETKVSAEGPYPLM